MDKKHLCGNCGVHTDIHAQVCAFCKKSAAKNLNLAPTDCNSSLNSSAFATTSTKSHYFYGRRGLADFQSYLSAPKRPLRIRRAKSNPLKKTSECITISDSSDDDCNLEILSVTATRGSACNSPYGSNSEKSSEGVPAKVFRVDSLVPVDNSPPPHISFRSSSTLYVPICSLCIGQMRLVPISHLQITSTDLSMSVQDNIFRLKWHAVKMIEMSPVQYKPCLFVSVHQDCLATLRATFNMIPGKKPYFDPNGPMDQRYIVLLMEQSWFIENENTLRRRLRFLTVALKRPQHFFTEIPHKESKSRLNDENETIAKEEMRGKQDIQDQPGEEPDKTPSPPIVPSDCDVTTRSSSIQTRNGSRTNSASTEVKLSFKESLVELAIYPPPPAAGGISITNADRFCLNEGEFVNDVIIDFYLKYTMEELICTEDRERSHVFSSFFFSRLTQPLKNGRVGENKDLSTGERRHIRVRKWTRNVDLFTKDFIFIPINDSSHWYLAVVCFPSLVPHQDPCDARNNELIISNIRSIGGADDSQRNEIEEDEEFPPLVVDVQSNPLGGANSNPNRDSSDFLTGNDVATRDDIEMLDVTGDDVLTDSSPSRSPSNGEHSSPNCINTRNEHVCHDVSSDPDNNRTQSKSPCILIFDSLRTVSRSKTATILREYLTEEWKYRKSSEQGDLVFDSGRIRMCTPTVPQQDNYTDCGLFLLHYVEKMFQNPIEDFTLPIKSLSNWFDPDEVKLKRQNIRDLIEKLRISQDT